ncbi:Mediator of rna polymerase II transcription subunit 1-like protein [Columba livia]|nr:Mediator of rna polymerase II transcription subunit 1-like protein [Columba livia]
MRFQESAGSRTLSNHSSQYQNHRDSKEFWIRANFYENCHKNIKHYQVVDKPLQQPASNAPDSPLLSCMEKIQRTLNGNELSAKSLFSVMNRLEYLSKQKGLNAHVSPSGTACYITSNMFYIEVQLEKDGNVIDVKLAHFGEAPVVKLIVSHLLVVSYLASSCHAFGFLLVLSHACQPGHDTIYLFRHLNLLPKLLTRLQIISIIELNIKMVYGHTEEENTESPGCLSATATLTLQQPKSKASSILRLCGKPQFGSNPETTAVVAEIILTLPKRQIQSVDKLFGSSMLSESLPDCPKHCYFINKGSEKSDLSGALVSKIPFSHPKCVPGVIEILRHQVAYNTLISSCVSDKHINEVLIDVITSREVQCHLHLNPQDPTLNSSDDFIARAVKRCMSVPVVMRAIFRNAAKVKADSETQDMEADAEQKPEPPHEQITDSSSLEESLSGAGQQDLVVTDKPSITDSPNQNGSTAKLETPGNNTEKGNSAVSTETLCGVEESNSTASTAAVMIDK